MSMDFFNVPIARAVLDERWGERPGPRLLRPQDGGRARQRGSRRVAGLNEKGTTLG